MSAAAAHEPVGPFDATPAQIRAALLPEEAEDFDRAYRRAMADATESLDLGEVTAMLRRWRLVAESTRRDPRAHRRMLQRVATVEVGGDIATEPWDAVKARLG